MNSTAPRMEVPIELKKLVQLVGRSFYQPIHIACLDILSKYPCVTEGDLVCVLRLCGSQRQLRQALTFLKKDKLVKSQQRMEGDSGLIHYYYINYKHFVNVVKYKLDQIRKKIETEEKRVQNRTSYNCPACNSSFSDLDVDHLFNPTDCSLRCSHCSGTLVEDTPDVGTVDARTLISRLNEQIRPLTDLLKKTEDISLAPEVLEPEPQSIQQVQELRNPSRKSGSSGLDDKLWNRNRPAVNMYSDSADVSVSLGFQDGSVSKLPPKERPEWLVRSTVQVDQSSSTSTSDQVTQPLTLSSQGSRKGHSDDQIMMDLLTHESRGEKCNLPSSADVVEEVHYSSSSTDSEDDTTGDPWLDIESPSLSRASPIGGDTALYNFVVKVGDDSVPLHEITDDMVARMTEGERELYKRIYQLASTHADNM